MRQDAKPLRYGNGHYICAEGVWRYASSRRRVPGALTARVNGRSVLWAPELHPDALVDNEAAAKRCMLSAASWRSYVARGLAPTPVIHLGGSPFWTRGVLADWLRQRPGKGGRRARRV